MATCEQKQAWLAAAENAWHLLQMGGQVVRVRYDGKETEFSAGNANGLARYILKLREDIAACTGVADSGIRRVIHVVPTDSR